jgi:integrase
MAAGAGAWVRPFRDGFRVFYRVEPGGKLNGSKVFKDQGEAEELAAELRAKIVSERRTVGSAIDDYQADMRARGLAERTCSEHPANIRRLLADVLEAPLAALTPRRADMLYLVATKGVSPATARLWLANARTWGEWCMHKRRRWFRANPFAEVEAIGATADHRSEHLRVDEARKYRDEALKLARTGDHMAVAALLPLLCGLIPSEIIQIQARDIDDDGALLWVAGKRLKTKNRRRSQVIADEELRALLVAAAKDKAPEAFVFASERREGRAVTRQYITIVCQRIGEAAGVPVADALMLRRTFATLNARQGSSLDELAFRMGHGADGKAKTAQRYYVAPGAVESGAAKRVLGVLEGGKRRG